MLVVLLVAPSALALTEPARDEPPPRAVPAHIPPAARGFQGALRSGASFPWGKASEAPGDDFSARTGWQVPITLDAGFKLSKPVFLGVYLGLSYGSSGSELCAQGDVSCSLLSYHFGVQAQYQFGASETINPWVGYGVGYEIVEQSLESGEYSETQSSSGLTYLKAAVGADFRSVIGLGPFVEVTAGRFESSRTKIGDTVVHEGPVDESAWHGLLTVGVRLVVLP